MKKKVLITGASGFLGFHLIQEAMERGYEVYGAVRQNSHTDHLPCKLISLPYEDEKALQSLLQEKRFDYIVHAAAMTRAKRPEDYYKVNVQYSLSLAKAASLCSATKSFLFVGSLAAIGPVGYSSAPITENFPKNPVTGYGRSKREAEEELIKIPSLPLKIVRPTAIYGPREKDLEVLVNTILSGWDAYIGHKPQKLSFIHGRDAARAIWDLSELEGKGPVDFNLTDGNVYTRYDFADAIKKITGKKAIRLHLPTGLVKLTAGLLEFVYKNSEKLPVLYKERLHELTAESWEVDISRLREHTAFEPKYDLISGLEDTLKWKQKGQ
jgi:nucleoside-diphosphate-sugar epimerase